MVSRLAFVLLGALSAWLTYRGICQRFALPWAEKRRFDLPFDHLGMRVRRVFLEVFLQTKVIRNRRIVGVMHALVMWGFVAFAGVSLRHLWLGIAPAPEWPIWYRLFVAVWAALVLVGIGGLAFRRFVLRPPVLGHLSASSGMVALLIITLMVTYLVDWSGRSLVIWWLHTVALLAFPPLIVRSKHLHLVLAPITIFFRPENTSHMRPLPLDADGIPTEMGLTEFKELSLKDVLDINACVECGRCTAVCPANRSGSTLDPKQLILQMQHGFTARGTTIVGDWVRESDLFDCTTCGACEEACPVGIEHVRKIVDLRHGIVNNERATLDRVKKQLKPLTTPPFTYWKFTERAKLIGDEQFPIYTKGMDYLLWLGCSISTNAPEIARDMKVNLDAVGASWGVLRQEICCGEVKHTIGMVDVEITPQLMETFRELDVKTIIACDPHCTGMFNLPDITVIHHSVFLQKMLPILALNPNKERVVFHDPCKASRGLGITAQPREVLAACGAQVVEPAEHGRRSTCCGAGGGQSMIGDEHHQRLPENLDRQMNLLRFDALMATKPDVIVAACPNCLGMLRSAAGTRGVKIPIQDIATHTASRIPKKDVQL